MTRSMQFARKMTILFPTIILVFLVGSAAAQDPRLTILHTNDMHSHFLGAPNADYDPTVTGDGTTGGIARIATLVKQIRAERDLECTPVLLLDGGDFAMGTLFHLLEGEAEMGIMNHLEYDHITLGNHEFDLLPEGAASIVGYAAGLPVEATNTEVTDVSDPGGAALQALIDAGAILPYKVDSVWNGAHEIKYGVFGLIGDGAANVVFKPFGSDAYPLEFTDRFAAASNTVAVLRDPEGHNVDLVICLSHSGVDEPNVWEGEDPELAAAVPGIDVIISGHTHTDMPTPQTVNGTIIVQAKAYTKRLGELNLELTPSGLNILSYNYHTIDDTILGDAPTQALVDTYIAQLDSSVLPSPYTFHGQIAETDFDLKKVYKEEHNLGNLVADAIRWSVDQVLDDPSDPVDVAVESNGVIRDAILVGATGRINTSDAFRAVPLGADPISGAAGYPIVSFCMSGADLYNAAWVNALAPFLDNSDYWLSWSGAGFQYLDLLPPLSMWQCLDESDPTCAVQAPIPNSPGVLYRVAVNFYIASLIGSITDLSYGLIVIVPKDCDTGLPLASLADAIIWETPGVDPLTQWEGFLAFLAQFPDTDDPPDGIPNIPARYAGPEGRMVKACVIATVSYGSPFDEKVGILRDFRDKILLRNPVGRKFVDLYYEHGGFLAEAVAEHEWVRALIRVLLLPLVGVAKLLLLFV